MITIKIDAFEGPLDLLLHLINQAEVDIYDISVSEITDQYVAYIRAMQELELEVASEFLVMAATLLAMKSKMLLPQEDYSFQPMLDMEVEEVDPREELIQRLLEYKKYKELASRLREKETMRSQTYTRPAGDLSVFIEEEEPNPVQEVSLFDLLKAFQVALTKRTEEPLTKVEREEWSIDERMEEIRSYVQQKKRVAFSHFFEQTRVKVQVVVTFLAILELMKKKEIHCLQQRLFDEIWITPRVEDRKDGS